MSSRHSLVSLVLGLVAFVSLVAAPAASHGETVYFTGFNNGGVYSFSSNASGPSPTLTTILSPGSLAFPTGVALGSDGDLYVGVSAAFIDNTSPSIVRIDLSNNSVSTVFTFSTFLSPAALTFQEDDLLVGRIPFSTNNLGTFGSNPGPVVVLQNAIGGSPTLANYTTGNVTSAPGLALGASNELYVADQTYNFLSGNATGPVVRFDSGGAPDGTLIPDAAPLQGPTGLVISGNDLYTTSIMNGGSILRTDLTSNSTSVFTSGFSFPTTFAYSPGAIDVLSGGDLLVADSAGTNLYEMVRIGSGGTVVDAYDFGVGAIGGIAVAPVPEPTTTVLFGAGAVAIVFLNRRRSRMSR